MKSDTGAAAPNPNCESDKGNLADNNAHPMRGGGGRTALLPCPFCASKAAFVPRAANIALQKDPSNPKFGVSVICGRCGSESPNMIDEASAAEKWNRRAPSAPADKAEAVAWRFKDLAGNTHYADHVSSLAQSEITPLFAAQPTELLRDAMEALDLLTELHDAMGAPQGAARIKAGAALSKLREQLGEQG